jgi:hypothetical protein
MTQHYKWLLELELHFVALGYHPQHPLREKLWSLRQAEIKREAGKK